MNTNFLRYDEVFSIRIDLSIVSGQTQSVLSDIIWMSKKWNQNRLRFVTFYFYEKVGFWSFLIFGVSFSSVELTLQ